MFCQKGALKHFANFTGKHLCWSLVLIKLQARKSATLLKKSFWYMCFLVNFVKSLRTSFFTVHLQWLLLCTVNIFSKCLVYTFLNSLIILVSFLHVSTEFLFFCYLGFLSQTFTNHRTAGKGGGHFFNSSLLPPDSLTLAGRLLQRAHLCT